MQFQCLVLYVCLAPDVPNFLGLYHMEPGTDYAQQKTGVNAIDDETITELMRIVCYDQPIYEDDYVEGDEWLGLTLDVDRSSIITNVRPMYDQAVILIEDNDSEFHNFDATMLPHCSVANDVMCIPLQFTQTLSYAVAVVGLEETFFSVSEDVGVVELCANVSSPVIDCPIKFPFEVQLSACDGIASNAYYNAIASFTAYKRSNHKVHSPS